VPDYLVLTVPAGGEIAATAQQALRQVQALLATDALATATAVFLTTSAVPAFDDDADPAGAAVWGLIRSAQAENPGRFLLADVDGDDASWRTLPRAVMLGEAQLALRAGEARVPRLAPIEPASGTGPSTASGGSALITGATTPMGLRLARHLVDVHGVRHLVLTDIEDPKPTTELTASGAIATTAACAPDDRAALRELIDGLPAEHPLTMVVHVPHAPADDRTSSLAPESLADALRATIGTAQVLDQEIGDAALVLCSSFAGTVGGDGTTAEAASATALDAFARRRRARGAATVSLAWGPWTPGDEPSRARITGAGRLGGAEAIALFDVACLAAEPVVIPARLDLAELARRAQGGEEVPPAFRALVKVGRKRKAGGGAVSATSLQHRLATMADADRHRTLFDLVRTQVSAVLGHESPDVVQPNQIFRDLGFDSLSMLTLRNRLNSATGLRLDPSLIRHDSTPNDLVERIKQSLT
jgi:acyl carrier protein